MFVQVLPLSLAAQESWFCGERPAVSNTAVVVVSDTQCEC